MTPMVHSVTKKGFTLVETIVYIGLFGIMFSGIFVSIYPILTGAGHLTQNILIEGETAFILSKIRFALADTITSPQGTIATPSGGTELVLSHNGTEQYRFALDTTNAFCDAPLVCTMLTLAQNGDIAHRLPLNAQRVTIENFVATDYPAQPDGTPHYVEVSFTADGGLVGPVRYYLHF